MGKIQMLHRLPVTAAQIRYLAIAGEGDPDEAVTKLSAGPNGSLLLSYGDDGDPSFQILADGTVCDVADAGFAPEETS